MKKPDAESIKDPKRKEIYESLKALNAENEKLGVCTYDGICRTICF